MKSIVITVCKPCNRGANRKQVIKTGKKVPDYWRARDRAWEKAFSGLERNKNDMVCDSFNEIGRVWTF